MAFTYESDLSLDRDYIRFYVGDTEASPRGVRPLGANFSDAELTSIVTVEGNKNRAVAACFESLAAAWGRYVDTKIGPRDEKLNQAAQYYAKQAQIWREKYGSSASLVTTGFVTRVDGYSDDVDSGEVDETDYRDGWWE